ncbi:amino acid adenylation domain-containing protein [Ideonella sp. DXS22W]|uniref:Amino acid adenylation domain-containing protein n=1 Tax=Pseudaquabacterium inlustre TaxID=2984192 RepID=A0ABU9CH02_9BURK
MTEPTAPKDAAAHKDAAAQKVELLRRLVAEGKIAPSDLPIPPRAAAVAELPLSFAQEDVWLVDRIEPGSVAYNLAVPPLWLEGPLDAAALAAAFDAVVRRHEALRTTVRTGDDGEPRQVVADELAVPFETETLTVDAAVREAAVREAMRREVEKPFDLACGPLLRARLLVLGPELHALLLTMHHIVFDERSMGIVLGELGTLYGVLRRGEPAPLPPQRLHYADFALMQRRWFKGPAFERQIAYWRERLQGAEELRLPLERARAAGQPDRTLRDSVQLSPELSEALRALGRREGVTPFALMQAAFGALMHRWCGQDDVVIGSPVTTRTRPEMAGVVGFFVNMVVLRTDFAGRPSFREALARARDTTLAAMQHAQVPFDAVVRATGVRRRGALNPLFQVAFAFESGQADALAFDGLQARLLRFHADGGSGALESAVARFDVEAYARDEAGCLSLELSVTERLGRGPLRHLLLSFRQLVAGIVAEPDRPLAELPLLDEAMRRQVLDDWNRTGTDWPQHSGLVALFAAQVARAPDAVAVEHGAQRLSYAALDAAANRLAQRLAARGVGAGTMVGVALPRSVALVTALLAIVKAGAAYVPLDPDYPADRLAFMLEDTAAPVVVTDAALAGRLPPAWAGRLLRLEGDADVPLAGAPLAEPPGLPAAGDDASRLAYVIYTSGSTGRPKGVMVEQRSIVRLVCGTDYVQIGPGQRVAQVSVVSFDAATFEIWAPLLNGGTVVVVPRETVLAPDDFSAFLAGARLSALFLTTALFNQMSRLAPAAFRPVGAVLFGGEACDPAAIRRVLDAGPPGRLLHVYGPTEVTTFATAHEILDVAEGAFTVPIGRPIANTRAVVLDPLGQPLPMGVAGELYLGGPGVARGYLNRPDATAQAFVPDPFSREPGARLYRTGDQVRQRAGGAIEFVGRRDHQVKLRGFRIELGEVETALRAAAALSDVLAMVREDEPGDRRLVAYVVPAAGATVTGEALRAALRERLPAHAVPAAVVVLPRMPLNANGKIDRGALPPPTARPTGGADGTGSAAMAAGAGAPDGAGAAVPPSALEARIAGVYAQMLGLDAVDPRANFFELGGHSLLLVRTHARLVAALGIDCKVVDLFSYPTVASLAAHLQGQAQAAPAADPLAAEARARQARRRSGVAPPIAIVAMAGRFPGAADVQTFWDHLCAGREAIRFFSADEMRASGVPESLIADPDHVPARGWLADVDQFDAGFFGYSAREAEAIDPQQRLLLECAHELLDAAGIDPERSPAAIGVFAGASQNSYHAHLLACGAELPGGLSRVLAGGQDFLATRLSYKLNLRGPALNLQTACSTSLVAVHAACRALADHECDAAMAGGVSVTVPTLSGHVWMPEGIGSRDGHCRAFDADAGGTVGGNGVALVMLKRLDDALADGDRIHAVIRGSAINNDGAAKVGYTAPSVEGQARAIALAQAAAGLTPDEVQAIEAHGTGTALGDPIEIEALTRVFGPRPRAGEPCWIGALKTHVGHLDAAAGVAGLIKAALQVEHGRLAPTLHFHAPNPRIDFAHSPFAVNATLRDWQPPAGTPRRIGVSSFGLGGTNAHVVLEQAPERPPGGAARDVQLLPLSARSPAALERLAQALAQRLAALPATPEALADVAWTLQTGRREFAHRRIVVARSGAEAAARLAAAPAERAPAGQAAAGGRRVVFLFSGQGSQYPGMGAGLYRDEPVFRDAVDRCAEALMPRLGLDLRTLLFPADAAAPAAAEALQRTEIAQPALFTIGWATAQWWQSVGVRPAAVLGHSIGEWVAACVAGVLSLDDALSAVAERGRLMGAMAPGAMLSVPLAEAELLPLLPADVELAAENGPALCTVAGPQAAIAALEATLEAQGLAPRRLHTSHAFHSAAMTPALAPFAQHVATLSLRPPALPCLSNLDGQLLGERATDPAYWAQQLRAPVRFSQALQTLFADPAHLLLEVGPGGTLAALARGHAERPAAMAPVASLRHPGDARDDLAVLLEAAGRLWLQGVRPDWAALHRGARRLKVDLPATPLERRRYWIDARPGAVGAVGAAPGQAAAPASVASCAPLPAGRLAQPADWLYLPSWRRTGVAPAQALATRWLLVAAAGDVRAGALATALQAQGAPVQQAMPSDVAALAAWVATHSDVIDGSDDRLPSVVWLGTTGAAGADERDAGFHAVAAALRVLGASGRPARLAYIAERTLAVQPGEALVPERCMALAPLKVAAMEHPGLVARAIDCDAATPAARLAADLLAPWADPAVAWRRGARWVQGFEALPTPAPAPMSGAPGGLADGDTVLITGGLGGVGLALAAHCARRARVRLVLVGRSGLPPRDAWAEAVAAGGAAAAQIRAVQALEAQGAAVLVCRADVADAAQMEAALAIARARFGAIDVVVHAAGADKHGRALADLDAAHCAAQWRPKIDGLRVLDALLAAQPPRLALLHSSLAAVTGVAGFASYVAAHQYLDAVALSGGGALGWRSIGWDHWGAGEAARDARAMPVAAACEALDRALGCDEAWLLVSTEPLDARVRRWALAGGSAGSMAAGAAGQDSAMAAVGAVDAEGAEGAEKEARDGPSRGHPRPALATAHVAPRSALERTLAGLWQQVLGIDGIGVDDDFFELGGDSVLNLQIAGRARQAGLAMSPRLVFEHPTIARLAAQLGDVPGGGVSAGAPAMLPHAQAPAAAGPLPLTAIQAWFLGRGLARPQHFNLPLLLEMRQPVTPARLLEALAALAARHEALRLRFACTAGAWQAEIAASVVTPPLARHDLSALDAAAQDARIDAAGQALQAGLDLAQGPLWCLAWFDLGPARTPRLLFVAHHLIVDMIAWRVLLEDLQLLVQCQAQRLAPPGVSLRHWAEHLHRWAASPAAAAELPHWRSLRAAAPLPCDDRAGANDVASAAQWVQTLDAATTRALVAELPRTAGGAPVRTDDALLLALAQAVCGWAGGDALLVDVEGHGRDALEGVLDTSRTVGWFTTVHPLRLVLPPAGGAATRLAAVRAQRGAVPRDGAGFGVLRHLSPDAALRTELAALPAPELSFLYLGQFDQAFAGDAMFVPALEPCGAFHDPHGARPHLIEVNALITQGQLRVSWGYSRHRHHEATVRALADAFAQALRALVTPPAGPRYSGEGFAAGDLAEIARQLAQSKVSG